MVWGVAKGSFVNKAILVPSALAISTLAPGAITPLLMLGGAYLCFEGCETLARKFLHLDGAPALPPADPDKADIGGAASPALMEHDRIKGAVRTGGGFWQALAPVLLNTAAGVAAGATALSGVVLVKKMRRGWGVDAH